MSDREMSAESRLEPALIQILRHQASKPEKSFGVVVLCPPSARPVWRALAIRPQVLEEREDGERLYRVTTRQAVEALRRWESMTEGEGA